VSDFGAVAFDIETTGFETDDKLTVFGFDFEFGSRIFLNTGERASPAKLEHKLDDKVTRPVSFSSHRTERELLEAVVEFAEAKLRSRKVKLVAYNGERWNGGFDLPFLRTRLSRHDVEWPFASLPYVDVMDVFETHFNTSENTLEAVYDELIGEDLTELDPFDENYEAVDTWGDGDFSPLVVHNLADIRRTRALVRLAERYCSKSDFSMKSLDPVA
jgi:DNA polymerase elongation subunit (family B)